MIERFWMPGLDFISHWGTTERVSVVKWIGQNWFRKILVAQITEGMREEAGHQWGSICSLTILKNPKESTKLPFWLELRITKNAKKLLVGPSRPSSRGTSSSFIHFLTPQSYPCEDNPRAGRNSIGRNRIFAHQQTQICSPQIVKWGSHPLFVSPFLERAVLLDGLRSKQKPGSSRPVYPHSGDEGTTFLYLQ